MGNRLKRFQVGRAKFTGLSRGANEIGNGDRKPVMLRRTNTNKAGPPP
jgi:hypothetical protein